MISYELVMSWFVYIVECSDNSLYCGITNNIQKRIDNHNKGYKYSKCHYTTSKLPVILKYMKEYEGRSEASKEEYRIKQLSREQKISIINSEN